MKINGKRVIKMGNKETLYELICELVAVNQEVDHETAEEIVQAAIHEAINLVNGESLYKNVEEVVLDYLGLDYRYLWALLYD